GLRDLDGRGGSGAVGRHATGRVVAVARREGQRERGEGSEREGTWAGHRGLRDAWGIDGNSSGSDAVAAAVEGRRAPLCEVDADVGAETAREPVQALEPFGTGDGAVEARQLL